MSERALERWLADKQADPELCRLLRAGKSDGPPPQALRMAPLAISALLTVSAAAAAAPVAESVVRNAFTSALIKWFTVGAVVGAASISVTQGLRQERPDDTKLVQRALPAARPRVSVQPTPLPAPEPVSIDPPQSSPAPVKVRAARPDVAREVALLDAARRALLQGDPRRALDTLAGLDRLPARSLQPEATVLRVRALLASNDVEGARQTAARFVAAAPGSPQAPVLRGLFAEPLEASERFGTTPKQSAIQTGSSEL
jgi:hypothetical protein